MTARQKIDKLIRIGRTIDPALEIVEDYYAADGERMIQFTIRSSWHPQAMVWTMRDEFPDEEALYQQLLYKLAEDTILNIAFKGKQSNDTTGTSL